MESNKTCQAIYADNKEIHDRVRFENVRIIYETNQDIEVEYVADCSVKGSSQDWIGIYEVNWKDYESFLTYQSVFGMPCDDSGRRRRVNFKAKWLKNAKSQTHYQFVYINKYLEILGVSQYFQMKTGLEGNSLVETSLLQKPCSSPIKEEEAQAKQNFLPPAMAVNPLCRLYCPTKRKELCTSCHHCKGIFKLRSSCAELLAKQKEYEDHIEHLQERIKHLEKCLEIEQSQEKENFRAYVWSISQAIFQHEQNKSGINSNSVDWDYSKRELLLKAIAGHQEITIQEMNKVISLFV